MGKIIDSVVKAGRSMLPKFDEPKAEPVPVEPDPLPELVSAPVEPEPDYERTATPAQIALAGIKGGMQSDEVRERLKRVMALPPCDPPLP